MLFGSTNGGDNEFRQRRYGWWGGIYGLGIFGAFVFYFQQADTFWEYVPSFIQSLFWPASMVYEVFAALGV